MPPAEIRTQKLQLAWMHCVLNRFRSRWVAQSSAARIEAIKQEGWTELARPAPNSQAAKQLTLDW